MLPLLMLLLAADPSGWTRARWGMTQQQILDTFPGQAVRQDDAGCPIAIPQVPIGEAPYKACFTFSPDGLDAVHLTPVDRPTDREFDHLEGLLVEKYGKPWRSRLNRDWESRWSWETTRISLSLTRYDRLRALLLQYRRKSKSDSL